MSRRGKQVRVHLAGLMSDAQIEIVRDHVLGQLIGQAGDLDRLDRHREPEKAIGEVATLGRLAFWLAHREILVPDRHGERLMRRIARELDEINQAAETTGGDPPAEHDALWAYVGLFSDWPSSAEVRDVVRRRRISREEKACGRR